MQPNSSGADVVVDILREAGVKVAFGLPGVHNLALWQACLDAGVRLVGVRHEQTTAYAADGYARRSGRLGVALTTTGPGAANAIAATGEAWASGSPVLLIATDIPTTLRRPGVHRGVLHETRDQAAMFGPVVKASFVVRSPAELADATAQAVAAALTPPTRPVYLEIPTDLLSTPAAAPTPLHTRGGPTSQPLWRSTRPTPVEEGEVARAAALLATAQRPLIWAGGGARDAAGEVSALAERLGAPVLETYAARGLLSPQHPLNPGATAHYRPVGDLWDRADVVVAVGTDFDGMTTQNWEMPQPPALIAINVDAADARKAYEPSVLLEADAAQVTAALLARLASLDADTAAWVQMDHVRARTAVAIAADEPQATALLTTFADDDLRGLPVVADMCIAGYWLAGAHAPAAPRRLAYPVGWGTLGFALPASIGTATAHGGPVFAVLGDGGFAMATGELATIVQERLPVVVVLFDDGGYGMLRYDQERAGRDRAGVDLAAPDFLALAAAYGIPATAVADPGAPLLSALRAAVAADEPRLVVVRVALRPPVSTSPRWYRAGRS